MKLVKWLCLVICLVLAGCRQAPEVREQAPFDPIDEATAKAVALFAKKGFDDLRKQGVVIGKLEAYGNDAPHAAGNSRIQAYGLHYGATYQSRRVAVDAWFRLITEKNQTRLLSGRVIVHGPEDRDLLKVDL